MTAELTNSAHIDNRQILRAAAEFLRERPGTVNSGSASDVVAVAHFIKHGRAPHPPQASS